MQLGAAECQAPSQQRGKPVSGITRTVAAAEEGSWARPQSREPDLARATPGRIARTAIALADEQGPEAVTTATVALRPGVPMASL